MFIAFEGPDNTGKSTSAAALAASGTAIYNARKDVHTLMQKEHLEATELPITYDRIDWLTHMAYRLALPDREWNDDRNRTVFAMPDTHLVFKLHHFRHENFTADEVVDTPIAPVNQAYEHTAYWLMRLNKYQGYNLFKSIGIIEVQNTGTGYTQRMVDFDSASMGYDDAQVPLSRLVTNDNDLLEFLRGVDQATLR